MGFRSILSCDLFPFHWESEIKACFIAHSVMVLPYCVSFCRLALILGIDPINALMTKQNSKFKISAKCSDGVKPNLANDLFLYILGTIFNCFNEGPYETE